jgi:uncharacterized protein YidB (DUF937 family)
LYKLATSGGGKVGLLDGILSAALGGSNVAGAAPAAAGGINADTLINIASQLLQQHGGVGGLVSAFNNAGLGHIVSSWVTTGANQPITAGQVSQVLGSGQLSQIASQLGVNPSQAGSVLAQLLPHVVDHLTPNGQLPATGSPAAGSPAAASSMQGELLNMALGALKSKLLG